MNKVSIILPIYNVSQYLRECLDSVISQTLTDIEIICVNDGSTDNSLSIIDEYKKKDSRIVVITGPNGGYGKAMNKGLDIASGEYIGIVEPDDYVNHNMYEALYEVAKKYDLDFVKSDFYRFKRVANKMDQEEYEYIDKSKIRYNEILNPSRDPSCIRFTLNTWTGIYKRSFLNQFHIRHHETPGASFQDNGFYFQTFVFARRAMILNRAYYHNRRDNPNSSVQSKEKVYCMNIEYDFIRDILMQDQMLWERFKAMYWWKKYFNYIFTLDRIGKQYKKEYLQRMQQEFKRAMQRGELNQNVFTDLEWKKIQSLIHNADGFYGVLYSAKLVRCIIPYIPRSVKQLIMNIIAGRE